MLTFAQLLVLLSSVLPLLLLLFCQCGGGGLGGTKDLMLAEKDGGFGTLGQSDFEGGGQVDTVCHQPFRSAPRQREGRLWSEGSLRKGSEGRSRIYAVRGSEGTPQ